MSDIPVIGPILFSQNIISYLTYILVFIVGFVIFKTSLGLTLRSCGENPEAADVAGVNVRKVRFWSVAIAGGLLFAIAFGISDALGIFAKTAQIGFLPTEFFNALPYILIIVLTICRKNLKMPANLGVNYSKEN